LGLGGYYAYQRDIFASTTTESVGCTITLAEDIKKDANSDRFSLYFGPVDWEKNLTEIEILRSEQVIRNNKRTLKINYDRNPAFISGFSRDPSNLNSGRYSFVDSSTFDCSAGKTFSVTADLRWASKKITITQTGGPTSTTGTTTTDNQPSTSAADTNTDGSASTEAESPEKPPQTTEPRTTRPSGNPDIIASNEMTDDLGSSYISSVEVTVKTEDSVPIRSAKITATTSKNDNDTLGTCSTGKEGTCVLRLNTKSTTIKLEDNDMISYSAEKNGRASTSTKSLKTSMQNGVDMVIKGLTASEAAVYQDPTVNSNQANVQVPTTSGFIGGNASVTIVPTRFTRVSNTTNGNSATAIGGVNFTLKAYYNTNGQTDNTQTQYRTSTQAFTYSTQNSLGSMFGGQQNRNFSGTIPDNGANSQLKISNLPAGNYLLTLEKSGFLSTNITFSLLNNEIKSAFLVNMRPREGAEPPSLSQQSVIRKKVDESAYWAQINNREYLYKPESPWYGWQLADQYITQEPTYSTSTGYSPQASAGSTTQGGYNAPWNINSESLADYLKRCQSMSFGQGVDAEDAAIATAISGFGNWLFGNETKNLENFAETTLIPGLTTYFAAQAMEESGGSINISTGNANCFPTNASPYYSGSSTNWYNYPNGYSTSNIPSECSRCLTTPPIVYDPNWCPSYCQNYANILGISPILSLLGSILD
jgi:hypothetical protein